MVDDRLVVIVCSMGEIHAYDIEPGFTEHVDLFHGIGLWALKNKSAKLIRSLAWGRHASIPIVQMIDVRR